MCKNTKSEKLDTGEKNEDKFQKNTSYLPYSICRILYGRMSGSIIHR